MHKFKLSTALTTLMLATTFSAHAGFFGGLSFGGGEYDTSATASNVSISTSKLAKGLFVGHLWRKGAFSYGVETQANIYDDKRWVIVGDEFTLRSRVLNLTGFIEKNCNKLSFKASAGASYVNQETRLIVTDPTTSLPLSNIGQTNNVFKPMAGISIGVNASANVKLEAAYNHIFATTSNAPITPQGNVETAANFNKIASLDAFLFKISYIAS